MAGIRKRSKGSWEIDVFLGLDENGKRLRRYETVHGKKADAERRRRETRSETDRGVTPTKTNYTVGEWLDKWLKDKIVPNLKPKSIERYDLAIRLHLKPTLGHIKLEKLTARQVQDLETKLLQRTLDPKGVEVVHLVLNGAMKHALRLDEILKNPVGQVSPPTVHRKEAYIPEIEQVQALLTLAEEQGHPLWVCIHLIAYTGMRRGEAFALEWRHIDLDEMQAEVMQSLVATKGGMFIASPKTKDSERVVGLDYRTVEILRAH